MKTTPIVKSTCDRCHQLYATATEGHDGLCPVCVETVTASPAVRTIKPLALWVEDEWEGLGVAFQTLVEHCGEAYPHFESPRGQADIQAAVSEYAKLVKDRVALLTLVKKLSNGMTVSGREHYGIAEVLSDCEVQL